MPDHVFSAARLRGYRVLEAAGLGDAVSFQVLDTVIASRLWLPFSLIEIGFRNAADRAITAAHPSAANWLIATGATDDVLVAAEVTGPPAFSSARADGSRDDPIADAARMAGRQLSRTEISRDDLIAHLMLGFWVNRCPDALLADAGVDLWVLIAATKPHPLDDADQLAGIMKHLLRTRNRVAHHEPLLCRAKHVFTRAGTPKSGVDLVASLQAAIPAFLQEIELTVETAKAIAPMATKYLDPVPDIIRAEIAPFEAKLAAERRLFREAREARIAARDAERTTRIQKES